MKQLKRATAGWLWKVVFDWGLWGCLVISLVIAFAGNESILRHARITVGSVQVGTAVAFLGIVLAGLSVFIAFLDEKYVALLEQVSPGIDADLWPFSYVAWVAAVCAVLGMTLIIVGYPDTTVFRSLFGLSLASFFYLLWAMLGLVKFVALHTKARVLQIQKNRRE